MASNPNQKIDHLSDFSSRGLHELRMWLETWFHTRNFHDAGGGGGTGGVRKLVATWSGIVPSVLGNGSVWQVPYDADGTTVLTFTLEHAYGRIETTATSSTTWRLEKMSPGADSAYSGSTITTVTVAAGHYQTKVTGVSSAVSSGDLLRIVFTAVGSEGNAYHVELVGTA